MAEADCWMTPNGTAKEKAACAVVCRVLLGTELGKKLLEIQGRTG